MSGILSLINKKHINEFLNIKKQNQGPFFFIVNREEEQV